MKVRFIASTITAAALTALRVYDNPKYDFSQAVGTWIGPVLWRFVITLVIWFHFTLLLKRFETWALKKGEVNK
jgi:hypothetical protein